MTGDDWCATFLLRAIVARENNLEEARLIAAVV